MIERILWSALRGLLFTFIAITFVFARPVSVYAQIPDAADGLQLTVSPTDPGPNTPVRFRVTDYAVSLPTSDIRWYVGESLVSRGVGMIEWSGKTGALGSSLTVTVVITTEDGESITKSLTLRPASLDLVWQADSAVPFFYPGKALPTTKNSVRFIALPHFQENGVILDPANLVYTWSLDFDPVEGSSGVGKNTFTTKIKDIIGDTTVSVRVSSRNGNVSAVKSIALSPSNPRIDLFADDPLIGPDFDHPLSNSYILLGEEVRLRAVGYYFPKSHISSPGLRYQWSLNGRPTVVDDKSPDTLTLRREADTAGQALVAASITDSFDSFISAAKSLTVSFGDLSFQ